MHLRTKDFKKVQANNLFISSKQKADFFSALLRYNFFSVKMVNLIIKFSLPINFLLDNVQPHYLMFWSLN